MGNGRVIAWGGYDRGKPRVRLLLDALAKRGAIAKTINIDVWKGVEDKSVASWWRLIAAILRLLIGYPIAVYKLLRSPPVAAVLLPYPAIPDIFIVKLAAKIRRQAIIFDAFIPLHDTIVRDRALLRESSLGARVIWRIERLALKWADIVLVDTDQQGEFLAREFGIDRDRFITVQVGAEPLFGAPVAKADFQSLPSDRPLVLFYGQLIPLHGLTTILSACSLTRDDHFHWVIVGRGQLEHVLQTAMAEPGQTNITWLPWVDYAALPKLIDRATLCLGVFGASDKAARVIPNKVFQALACGKPVITRSSPAMDSLASKYPNTIITVPADNPDALVTAIRTCLFDYARLRPIPTEMRSEFGPEEGVDLLLQRLDSRNSA